VRWAVVGSILSAVLLLFLGFEIGHAPVDGQASELGQKTIQLAWTQHRLDVLIQTGTRCWPYSDDIRTIRRLTDSGRYSAAASLANLDLSNMGQPACPQPHVALENLWYTASIDDLLATSPTSPLDQTPVLTWLGIERRANALGIPPDNRTSPLTIFIQAYNRQEWGLAQASFLRAWGTIIGPADLSQVVAYYSTLRNFGRALIAEGGSSRRAGLVMSSTAQAVSNVYGLNRGEARGDLIRFAGSSPAHWPRPNEHDPVLLAGRTGK
jgi:hypothetical protein